MTTSRINAIEQIESALRCLTAQGYDTTVLWQEHNEWLLSQDTLKPTDFDRTWATRAPAPSSVEEHFVSGEPELLTASRCHAGRQFLLSPGQRDVLRTRYGLTPTKIIIVDNVATFANEPNVMFSITIRSAEHVDPKYRRRVLNEVVLVPVAEFFKQAADRDKEREDAAVAEATKRGESQPKQRQAKSLALQYLS